jgi:hypothetical protein
MELGRRVRNTGNLSATGPWPLHGMGMGMGMERSAPWRAFTRVAHAGATAPCALVGLAAYPVDLAAMRRSRCMACR